VSASADEVAERLGYPKFDGDASLSEKLALGSSVGQNGVEELRLIIKSTSDLSDHQVEILTELLRQAWSHFTGSQEEDTAGETDASSTDRDAARMQVVAASRTDNGMSGASR
jgi:hypothetical protein